VKKYKRGKGMNLKVPGSEIIHGELSFTYLVDEKLKNYTELQEWFRHMTSFTDDDPILKYRNWMSEEGQLIVLSAKKNPKFIYIIKIFTSHGLLEYNIVRAS
jgi:hypothetical protein